MRPLDELIKAHMVGLVASKTKGEEEKVARTIKAICKLLNGVGLKTSNEILSVVENVIYACSVVNSEE